MQRGEGVPVLGCTPELHLSSPGDHKAFLKEEEEEEESFPPQPSC